MADFVFAVLCSSVIYLYVLSMMSAHEKFFLSLNITDVFHRTLGPSDNIFYIRGGQTFGLSDLL
jgi:hypothetical protein